MQAQEIKEKKLIESKFADLKNILLQDKSREIWNEIEEQELQELLNVLIKVYVSRIRAGQDFNPIPEEGLSGTDTLVFVDQLLKLTDIELFEIQIWRSLGSNY